MKSIKKIFAVIIAMTMALMLALPAFAATVTNEGPDGHTYVAYQVFTGDQADGSSDKLSNVVWGDGIDSAAFLAALTADSETTAFKDLFTGCTNAASVAQKLSTGDSTIADRFAEIAYANKTGTGTPVVVGTTTLAAGYYLLVDTTATMPDGQAYNKAMLQITDNITIKNKTAAPSVTKKVLENNDTTNSRKDNWHDAADYSIGDAVPFRLVGLVPDMSKYDTYFYQFSDTLSSGLTLRDADFNNIKVYVVSGTGKTMAQVNTATAVGAGGTPLTTDFTNAKTANGFTVTFDNLKSFTAGDYIVVEYTALLNESAVVGNNATANVGNPNEVVLNYSNNPNKGGEGSHGTTPKDEVVVFTFTLPVNKVDGDASGVALPGAKFAVFTDAAKANAAAANPTATGALTDALKYVGATGVYTKYDAVTGTAVNVLASDITGKYQIKGLDQGTYYLVETEAPAGYNRLTTAQAITVVAADKYTGAAYNNDHTPGAVNDQLTSNVQVKLGAGTPADSINVENHAGPHLPSTGGMGTTLFTILGIALMAGAAVLLVAKRRANK